MKKWKNSNEKCGSNKGFSLIELIIAIAILVILTGLLAPQFMKYIEKSRKAVCRQNIDTVVIEAQVLLIENEYTGSEKELQNALQAALHSLKPKCPSGGVYSVREVDKKIVVVCGFHDLDGGFSTDETVIIADRVFNDMASFLLPEGKTMEEWKKEITDREDWKKLFGESNYVNNDRLREYLYKNIYKGEWPKFDSDILSKNGFNDGTTLYVQPYIDIYYKGFDKNTNNNNIIVYAGTSQGNSWNATMFYNPDNNTWYKSPNNKSMGFANKSWDEIWDTIKDTWEPIKTD